MEGNQERIARGQQKAARANQYRDVLKQLVQELQFLKQLGVDPGQDRVDEVGRRLTVAQQDFVDELDQLAQHVDPRAGEADLVLPSLALATTPQGGLN